MGSERPTTRPSQLIGSWARTDIVRRLRRPAAARQSDGVLHLDCVAPPGVTCNLGAMAAPHEESSSKRRVREHRRRLRAQGLRPVQIWVPDVRSPEFTREAHRQAAAVAASPHATDDQAFIDAISLHDD